MWSSGYLSIPTSMCRGISKSSLAVMQRQPGNGKGSKQAFYTRILEVHAFLYFFIINNPENFAEAPLLLISREKIGSVVLSRF